MTRRMCHSLLLRHKFLGEFNEYVLPPARFGGFAGVDSLVRYFEVFLRNFKTYKRAMHAFCHGTGRAGAHERVYYNVAFCSRYTDDSFQQCFWRKDV